VPEDITGDTATTQGRVERHVLGRGTVVTPEASFMELSNPQLEQELQEALLKLKGAERASTSLPRPVRQRSARAAAKPPRLSADSKKGGHAGRSRRAAVGERAPDAELTLRAGEARCRTADGAVRHRAGKQLAAYTESKRRGSPRR